jgi:DNA-binding GntR family transcriptional regulator
MEHRRAILSDPARPSPDRQLSLTDQVYERLRREVIEGVWRPGQVLLEPELATLYGVSKTPVREALRLLVQEEWIVIIPRKGYLVRPLRLGDIGEIFGLRGMIEPSLIAEIARSGPSAAAAELRECLDEQMRLDGNLTASLDAARRFHLAPAKHAHNRRAESILERLVAEVRRLHFLMPDLESHITSSAEIDAHRAILAAVEAKDPEAAATLMREHLNEVARTMVNGFSLVPMA